MILWHLINFSTFRWELMITTEDRIYTHRLLSLMAKVSSLLLNATPSLFYPHGSSSQCIAYLPEHDARTRMKIALNKQNLD